MGHDRFNKGDIVRMIEVNGEFSVDVFKVGDILQIDQTQNIQPNVVGYDIDGEPSFLSLEDVVDFIPAPLPELDIYPETLQEAKTEQLLELCKTKDDIIRSLLRERDLLMESK